MDEADLPPSNHTFEYKLEKDVRQVYRSIQRSLSAYKDEKKGPTYIAIQSPQGMSYWMTNAQCMSHYTTQYLQGPTEWPILRVFPTKWQVPFCNIIVDSLQSPELLIFLGLNLILPNLLKLTCKAALIVCNYEYINILTDFQHLTSSMPGLNDFPLVPIHITDRFVSKSFVSVQEWLKQTFVLIVKSLSQNWYLFCSDRLYSVLDWQRVGCRRMIQHYLNVQIILQVGT